MIISKEETDPKEEGHLAYGGGCGSFLIRAMQAIMVIMMITFLMMLAMPMVVIDKVIMPG